MTHADYRALLSRSRRKSMLLSEFLDALIKDPTRCLHTSSTLTAEAIKHFGFRIVVRSGEPTISYAIFKDPFAGGINAVFGQEFCIKQIVDVIESVGKESGPNRGIVLVGPPASGKTNIVDLISQALEEYTKQHNARLYSFFFRFAGSDGRVVELRPPFMRNPILLFPTSLQHDHRITHPRRELFELINSRRGKHEKVVFPTYYQNASLDKHCLDILEGLLENPRNRDQSLFDILEECVRVEEVEFSNAQAKGIANIDDMRQLRIQVHPTPLGDQDRAVIAEHLSGARLYEYQGALVAANRGLLHIHDAFLGRGGQGPAEEDYKPLLMLLGSGKAAIESTQTPIDTTVVLTTNIEEMELLERQLTSSKLLDRIDEIPVNYLLDANSEMEILRRDMSNMREKYDVDPNLLRVAAYFSVLTRLLPPRRTVFPPDWDDEKKQFYLSISPEQKLFIYTCQAEDPLGTIRRLPHWHPFRGEMLKLKINIHDTEEFSKIVERDVNRISLEQSGAFTAEQLQLVDDEFMRLLWNEHYPEEGKNGVSVRQLQNIMRDTIAHSDGYRIHVGTFFGQLKRMFAGSPGLRHWLTMDPKHREGRAPGPMRFIGDSRFAEGEGDYGDYKGLARVTQALYNDVVRHEITMATVNRDPAEIALDLRRYLQHALLARAHENRAFAHIMVPRFTFIDPTSGEKVDQPDENYLRSIENILDPDRGPSLLRQETAKRFLDLHERGELALEPGKPVIASRQDNVLTAFGQEYQRLLSHRRTMGEIDADRLVEAFFQKRRSRDVYEALPKDIREFAETVIWNLVKRFGYSKHSALDTVLFAIRKEIVQFREIIS